LNLFGGVAGKTMLEVGCGCGHLLRYYADKSIAKYGIVFNELIL